MSVDIDDLKNAIEDAINDVDGQMPIPTDNPGNDAGLAAHQTNELSDFDLVEAPELSNAADPWQTVSVNGGSAAAGNGITDVNDAGNVGDDLSISGEAGASADAAGRADMFVQSIEMGNNVQQNAFSAAVTGGDYDVSASGGEGASFNSGQASDSQLETLSAVSLEQANTADDADEILDATVLSESNVSRNPTQTVTVDGGVATAGDGINSVGGGAVGAAGSVGDDLSIEGSAAASADAQGVATSANQALATGENTQINAADLSVTGADVNVAQGGGAGAGTDGAAQLSSISSAENVFATSFSAVEQLNELTDDEDLVETPSVTNASQLTQTVDVDGGTASAGEGVDVGGLVGASGVGGDASIGGSASASADAQGVAMSYTQDIDSGANQQANSAAISSVAGSRAAASAEENGATIAADSGALMAPFVGSTQAAGIAQENMAEDADEISSATVLNDGDNLDGGIPSEGIVTQGVTVNGGIANAGNGIASGSGVGNGTTEGDTSISGHTSASADAIGGASVFKQALTTGGNLQLNDAAVEMVGGSTAKATAGENAAQVGDVAWSSDSFAVGADQAIESANYLADEDEITDATVVNNPFDGTTDEPVTNLEQTVTVTGGTSTALDGVSQSAGTIGDFSSVGDDASIVGSSEAGADASGTATAFNQALATGGNRQINEASASTVGGHVISAEAGESGASVGAVNGGAPDGLTVIEAEQNIGQLNIAEDDDFIASPLVENQEGGIVEQSVASTGGTATAGNGIQQVEASSQIGGDAEVMDDASIVGKTSASADASAAASAFNQVIATGGNTQANQADATITGGNSVSASAGNDGVSVDMPTLRGITPKIDPVVSIEQMNDSTDNDDINDAQLVNAGTLSQTISSVGGSATSEDGISQINGGSLGAQDVNGDSAISGSASASADATAVASAFNQSISTGSNVQLNQASVDIVGGDDSAATAGENSASQDTWAQAPRFIGADSDAEVTLTQQNLLESDTDEVTWATVTNDGAVDQDVGSTGGAASSGDGIDQYYTAPDGARLGGDTVGDDSTIAGASDASADASGGSAAFGQSINVASNGQQNTAATSVVGGDAVSLSTGEDSDGSLPSSVAGPIVGPRVALSAETTIEVEQANLLDSDYDYVESARVTNDGSLVQNVASEGGSASAGSGLVGDGSSQMLSMGGPNETGDDASVSGSTNASADAVAQASAFNQLIRTGSNVQINNAAVEVTASNANSVSIGEDATGGAAALASGFMAGNADTLITLAQANSADDGDEIVDAVVTNASGSDVAQNVTANGGEATAQHGIHDDGASQFNAGGTVGDDYSVSAKALASADASAQVSAFNQTLLSGGNTQANAASVDFVGGNDTALFVGDDDSLDLSVTPSGGQLPGLNSYKDGTDTVFTAEQTNSLADQDYIENPSVISANSTDMDQMVSVDGGVAMAGDGILDAEDLFDFSAGDDMSIAAATSATADAMGVASAFNQTIVMGANVQANSIEVSVVGGSSTVNVIGEDDMAS
ncbi:hypothetical protein PUV47_13160 [Pseudovibrio exalbescens]|uniref:beta strand repeat-containing protein n=1 Tax=Pseudovibrio exalbescens TaxID=197461 RepID=UPI00236622EB|nr:hypothetical protein [Pseudovibrio exalbescens]MDD7910870.1 hypothetical protein [Pseudovibrio exalbescens]